ncbi:MAG: hypothetical protein ACLVAT_08555 [Lachnospiraceae bacterium]
MMLCFLWTLHPQDQEMAMAYYRQPRRGLRREAMEKEYARRFGPVDND